MHHKSSKFSSVRPLFLLLIMNLSLWAGQTVALFQPTSLTVGPFPTDALTVSDSTQKTGVRIDLPSSNDSCDPSLSPSVCSNSALLNLLDGFSVNPRVMVCFSGPVDPTTLASGIRITPAGGGAAIVINQIIFDPASNCAFAKPNQVLNQHSKYLLTVTDSVHDAQGKKVKEQDSFKDCLKGSDAYCRGLAQALQVVPQPASQNKVVAASLFTTLSATTWLEQARRYVDTHEPPLVLPAGLPFLFNLDNLKSISWYPAQSGLAPQTIPLGALSGVAKIAFGLYLSPNFLNPLNGTIATTGTNAPFAAPVPVSIPIPGIPRGILSGFVPVSFHVFLPGGPPPMHGFPLVIYGHGTGDNQFGAPTYIASTLARSGFATLAMEITGHGYGAGSTVQLTATTNTTYTVFTPGRGILLPNNSYIGPTDGCIVPGAIGVRDCLRQTAVDLVALMDTIQKTEGLGLGIDPNQVYYVGQSLGGLYGTLFHAVDPALKAAVLSGDGGTSVDAARLSISERPLAIEFLTSVNPLLLNVAPYGAAPPQAYFRNVVPCEGVCEDAFNDNYVFRDSAPIVNNVPGAMAIQAAFEAADWLNMLGDPVSYAPHLKTAPLAGVPPKATLFQFGLGDLEVPNPTESAVIRAANAQSSAWFFRFDIAASTDPGLLGVMMPGFPLPILPHRILSNPTIFGDTAELSLALAEQQQVAAYFASGGSANPDPNSFLTSPFSPSDNIFQVPATLPEQLNFLQFSP